MTLNILSTQANRARVTGPKKVLDNLLKGLDLLNIKYVLNQPINEYKYNWIHDDQKAMIEAGFSNKPILIGPNTAILPDNFPIFRKKLPKNSIYLHPSKWVFKIWEYLSYNETKLCAWPVGIDTDEFKKINRKKNNKVLLYFKERDLNLLEKAKNILEKLNLEYDLIHYGYYKEEEYKQALSSCKFGIWIGRQESQGIGLQEALATNIPLIVLDAMSLFDTVSLTNNKYFSYTFPKVFQNIESTTAPYFDERCGIKIEKIQELESSIVLMQENIDTYKPREYIKENLSLEKSAKQLISFFDNIDIKDNTKYNYQLISKVLFYVNLLFQKWAWSWLMQKIIK